MSDSERRRLETPSRSRKRGRDETDASRSYTRSRSRHRRSRARELDFDRERVQRLEQELQQKREILRQRERSSRRISSERQRVSSLRISNARLEAHRSDDARCGRAYHERRTSHIRSRSPTFSRNDVVKIVQSLKRGLESQSLQQSTPSNNKNIDNKNIIPNFDPSVKNQRIDVWLKKVNECAAVYGWDDKTTIHFSLQKLQGLAKTWFESLDTILYTWKEWQDKLKNAFPHEHNYGQCLEDMLKRKSKFNESIETYYYEKLALLNLCDIHNKRAVDCIIHGITDRTIRSSALALRCSHPEQLLQFLMSNRETINLQQIVNLTDRNIAGHVSSTTSCVSATDLRSNSYQGIYCFNCKERGHPYLNCPKPLIKCNRCNKIGHKTEHCTNTPEISSNNTDTIHKTMCIYNTSPNTKFN